MSYSEEEQLEQLKKFWNDHGTSLLTGALIAVLAYGGWGYWNGSKVKDASEASSLYQSASTAMQKLAANPTDKTAVAELQRDAKKVIDEHAGSPFAINAALLLARHAVEVGDMKEAEKQLRWVLDQKPDDGFRSIASLRLARVLAAKGDSKGALALLDSVTVPAFAPSRDELRGDLLKQSGDIAGARKAYEAVAKALQARQEPRPVLDMKMADVGLEAPEIKPPSPIREDKGA